MRPYYEPYSDDYPVGASRADLRAAPPQLSQKVFYGGQAWQPVPRGRQVHLKPWEQATPQERGRTYRGPVHLPGNRGGIIPRGRYHKAFTPNTQRQHTAVTAYARGGRGGGTWATPRVRGHSASRGSQRGQSPGRRSQGGRSLSAHSNQSFGRGGKGGRSKGGVNVAPSDPVMAPITEVQRAVNKLKPDETLHLTEEQKLKIEKDNEEIHKMVSGRLGRWKFLPAAAQRDVQTVDPSKVEGATKAEGRKLVLQFKRKQVKVLATAKKSHDNHEKSKGLKETVVEENLGVKYTDDTVWPDAALRIASQATYKVKAQAHFKLLLPYIIFERFLKIAEPDGEEAKKEVKSRLHRVLMPKIIAWLSASAASFEGFDVVKGFLETQHFSEALGVAIREALDIRSAAKLVKEKLDADFHANGDFLLHLALHAHLIRAGIAVQPSEYAAPAAAAAGLSSFAAAPPGPPRYVPLVRF